MMAKLFGLLLFAGFRIHLQNIRKILHIINMKRVFQKKLLN